MNETMPVQKQDIDRVIALLEAILMELKTLTRKRPTVTYGQPPR